jgi:uncharacterized membrane protein YkoI
MRLKTRAARLKMMAARLKVMAALVLLSGAALAVPSTQVCKEATKGLAAKAKISCDEARNKALAKVPGSGMKSAEIEEEHGKLVYSFDLKTKGKDGIDEVQVDAVTGEIVSVEHEDAKAEAAEKKADHAGHKAGHK